MDPVLGPESTTDLAALLDIPDSFTPEQREANQLLLEEHLSTKLGKYTAEYILQEGSSFDSGLADATDIELALNSCSAHISQAELKALRRIHDEVTGGGIMSKEEANAALKEIEGERIEKAKAAQKAARDARKARSNKKSKKRSQSKQPKGTQPAKKGSRAGSRSKSIVHDESDTPEPEELEKPRRWVSRRANWKDYLQAMEHSKSDSVSDRKAEDWEEVSSRNECRHGHDKRFPGSEASISEPDLEFGPWWNRVQNGEPEEGDEGLALKWNLHIGFREDKTVQWWDGSGKNGETPPSPPPDDHTTQALEFPIREFPKIKISNISAEDWHLRQHDSNVDWNNQSSTTEKSVNMKVRELEWNSHKDHHWSKSRRPWDPSEVA